MRSIQGGRAFHNPAEKIALGQALAVRWRPSHAWFILMNTPSNRRKFLASTSAAIAASALPGQALGRKDKQEIIDLHQHTNYSGRNDERLLRHQKALGIKWTVLLPAGRKFGLGAICGGNKSVRRVVVKNPKKYVHFANEIADHPECIETIETYLKKGAVGIGEQKFRVDCDSKHIERIAELANAKILPEISAVRDESDENTRVVVDLKRDSRSQVVLNNLYKHTALQSSFSANMLAIDNRRPRLLKPRLRPLRKAQCQEHKAAFRGNLLEAQPLRPQLALPPLHIGLQARLQAHTQEGSRAQQSRARGEGGLR